MARNLGLPTDGDQGKAEGVPARGRARSGSVWQQGLHVGEDLAHVEAKRDVHDTVYI